jgi:hypothetical protein
MRHSSIPMIIQKKQTKKTQLHALEARLATTENEQHTTTAVTQNTYHSL